ncbi:MAG: hydantoinase/oxoprolinase family protein, partial [Alphaproteobacteria bacterium]
AIDRQALDTADTKTIATAFHHAHHRVYDHSDPDAAVQIVNLRLVVAGGVPKPDLPVAAEKPGMANAAGETRVWLDGSWHQAAIYDRKHLSAGDRFSGPAIIGQDDTTTIVLPDFDGRVDG